MAKPADGRLLFIPEGAESPQAANLSAAIIDKSEITSISAKIKERGQYSGVITRYRDKETNSEVEVETTEAWQARLGAGPVFRDKTIHVKGHGGTSREGAVRSVKGRDSSN